MSRPLSPPRSCHGGALRAETARRWALAALALGALTLAPRPGDAFPLVAPNILRDYVRYTDPTITTPSSIIDEPLCHLSGSSNHEGFKALRPFGDAVRTEAGPGITKFSSQQFWDAYAALDEKKSDVDCDGYPDLDEIRFGVTPNDPAIHPSGPPIETSCFSLNPDPEPEPQPEPEPEPEPGDDDDDDDKNAAAPTSAGSSCALSSPTRPLDLSAFFVAGLVALPLIRRALRPRKRHIG